MNKYTHIGALHQVVAEVMAAPSEYQPRAPIKYQGTVKLHGSNCGISVKRNGDVEFQSRERVLIPGDDWKGFALWASDERRMKIWRDLDIWFRQDHGIPADTLVTFFGEWVGPGVTKGTALSLIPEKVYVLFNVEVGESEYPSYYEIDFAELNHHGVYRVLAPEDFTLEIDLLDPASVQAALDRAMTLTDAVAQECPFCKHHFGVEGPGEGIVWKPLDGNMRYAFKTKNEKFLKVKAPRVQAAPEVVAGIEEFVNFALPETRLEQGLEYLDEMGLARELKNMGAFLKWIAQDVQRETATDLEASGFTWKQVVKQVENKARDFFKEECA